jgi:hypothetical protein
VQSQAARRSPDTSAFIDFDKTGKIKSARFAKDGDPQRRASDLPAGVRDLENKPVPPTPNYERGGKVHLDAKPVPLNVTPALRERVHTAGN